MNKIFFVLLMFTVIGAGVLWWLIQAGPSSAKKSLVADISALHESTPTEEEHGTAKPEHATEAEESHSENKPEHKAETAPEHSAEHAPEHSEEKVSTPSLLKLITEPSDVGVYLNGIEIGQSPLEIKLLDGVTQKLRLEAEGFQVLEKVIPVKPKDGDLTWKLSLKAIKKVKTSNVEHEAHEAPVKKEKKIVHSENAKLPVLSHVEEETKVVDPIVADIKSVAAAGNYVVQIKSLNLLEINEKQVDQELSILRTALSLDKEVYLCKVNIPGKGMWGRVQVGPYKKDLAQAKLDFIRKELQMKDAFLAKTQECL